MGRCFLDHEFVVSLTGFRILQLSGVTQEDRENRIVRENISLVVRIRTDSDGWSSSCLFKSNPCEDNRVVVGDRRGQLRNARIATTLQDVRQTIEASVVKQIVDNCRVDNPAVVTIFGQRTSVNTDELLSCGSNVINCEIRTVCQSDVHCAVNAVCGVSSQLNKRVQGQCKPIIQLGGQVLEQRRIVNCATLLLPVKTQDDLI